MAPHKQSDLTPIRIRGKRRGTPAEKWHHGKRRKQELQKRPTTPERFAVTSPDVSTARPRERKRRDTGNESPLEQLPAEVIQLIFEYSANIDLPLTSRSLASTLSKSKHLQQQLTSEILELVLGHGTAATKIELGRATRLLNSRFVTWRFFTTWLRSHVATRSQYDCDPTERSHHVDHLTRLWASLQPANGLLPPKKLLCPSTGFTQETTNFLAILAHGIEDLANMDPAYGELAYEGLVMAIREHNIEVVSLMLKMGVAVVTETLRIAVAECGCNEDIVRMLLRCPGHIAETHMSLSHPDSQHADDEGAVDLLDPEIWAWADKAQEQGNQKGLWLIAELRSAQQRKRTSAT